MKQVAFFGVFLLYITGPGFPLYAQTDASAKSILQQLTQTYEGYKAIRADFTLTIQQPQQTGNYVESGTLSMETTTGKYRITTDNQDIISDGETQWLILKEEGEVQVTEVDDSPEAISPANIFSFYNHGYKYVSAPNETANGQPLLVVELSPEDAQNPYFKIKLRILKSKNWIYDATIFDKSGVRYTYLLKNTTSHPSMAADTFVFKQTNYPGIEIVDLR